jgi:hypothetical protein
VVATLTVLVALAAMAQSCVAAAPPQLSPAAQTLSQCVQTNHELAVLMLIDESGSLRTTDPLNQRVDGIRAALTGLADLADTPVSGRKPKVSVLMAGFYGRVHPDPSTDPATADAWRTVDGSTVDELIQEASLYESRNVGKATDYATALLAAHRLLVEGAAELARDGGAPPCKALIWFTDGRYAIPLRVGKAGEGLPRSVSYAPKLRLDEQGAGRQAVTAGKKLMCRPAGLMDEIANDGIVRFTVALATKLSAKDDAFLDAATTGFAGVKRCGVDLSERTGEYLARGDGDRLFFAFGDLLAPSASIDEKEVCPRLVCLRGTTTFKTFPGLSGFLIRASSGIEGAVLVLQGPDGKQVQLQPGDPTQLTVSGATVVQRWVSDRAVEVEGDFPPGETGWIGPWTYTFVDPSPPTGAKPKPTGRNSLQLFSDLEPTLVGERDVIRGVPTELKLGLASGSGSDLVSGGPLVQGAAITATVSDPTAETTTSVPVVADGNGEFTATVSVPNSSPAGVVYLGLTASLATDSGAPIAPQYRSFRLQVQLPPGQGFPILHPAELQLPSVEGEGSAEGTITVTGSSVGGGCVWVGPPETEAPEDAGHVEDSVAPSVRSATNCLRVDKGESRQLKLRLTPSKQATGTVAASFPVHLSSDFLDGTRVTSLPVTFVLVVPPDDTTRLVLLVALILVGALLPLALLYLLNRFGARFTAPQRLLLLAQDVVLSSAGIEAEVEPVLAAFKPLSGSGAGHEVREMDVDRTHFRTVAARNLGDLFRGPYGIAGADGARIVAGGSSARLREWNGGTEHEVPLSISGTWIFLPSRDAAESPSLDGDGDPWGAVADPWGDGDGLDSEPREGVKGRLILLISRSGNVGLGQELLDDASAVLRETDIREASENGGPPADEARSVRARLARWIGKQRKRGDGDTAEPQTGTEPVEPDRTSSEVDPWA